MASKRKRVYQNMRELYEALIDLGISHEENGEKSKYYFEVFRNFGKPTNKTEKLEIWLLRNDTTYKHFVGFFPCKRTRQDEAKVIIRCANQLVRSGAIMSFINNEMLLRASVSFVHERDDGLGLLMQAFPEEFLEQPVEVVN